MSYHYESSYEVGFNLAAWNHDVNAAIACIFERLGFRGLQGLKLKLNSKRWLKSVACPLALRTEEFRFRMQGHRCSLHLENVELLAFSGADPKHGTPYRRHEPKVVRCIVFKSDSRSILELLLRSESIPYQLLRVHLTDKTPKINLDPITSLDTEVYLVTKRTQDKKSGHLEAHCIPGMLTAHRIFRVPLMLQILSNRWPTTNSHGVGWAVRNTNEVNRTHKRGSELLQWEPGMETRPWNKWPGYIE